ncbi:hypothetical protein HY214_02145 [Candidatus Roizmanbacteria bacterium]|nr:hypothetical protein [Candidatus Roizmanbacteria bacterium]
MTASVGAIAFLFLFYSYPLFAVRKIAIDGSDRSLPLKGLTTLYRANLLLLSTEEKADDLLRENPRLKTVVVTKEYPATLHLTYTFLTPVVFFTVDDGFYILSEEGKILERLHKKSDLPLPIITYYQKIPFQQYKAGNILSFKDIQDSLAYLKKIVELSLPIDSIDIKGTNMIVCNLKEKTIIFTTSKDRGKQLFELESIVRKFKIEGREFTSLDLRFDKPVVTF